MKGGISKMYQKEWDNLKKRLLEGLSGYIDQVHYTGRLDKNPLQLTTDRELDSSGIPNIRFLGADYKKDAEMNITVHITDEKSIDICKEKIKAVLQELGCAVTATKLCAYSCDNGPITMNVAFQRTISAEKAARLIDEYGEQ